MEKLDTMALSALFYVSRGDCNFKNKDLHGLPKLEELDYVTPWSEFRNRKLTDAGQKLLDNVLTITQGVSVMRTEKYDKHSEIFKLMDGCIGIVEANSNETLHLYEKYYKKDDPKSWVQGRSGIGYTMGHVAGKPVCVSVTWNIVNGHKILFIEPTSYVVDYELIENWFKKHAPKSMFQQHNSEYLNMRDANNFHCLLPHD